MLQKDSAVQKLAAGGWWLFSCLYAVCRICWKLWIDTWHWPQKYVLLLVDPAFQTVSLFNVSGPERISQPLSCER